MPVLDSEAKLESNPSDTTPAALERLALVCRALGDPARLRVLEHLARQGEAGDGACDDSGCEAPSSVCACDLEAVTGLAQPTVSHHMKCLVSAGLVRGQKRGRWTYYGLEPRTLEDLRSLLARLGSSAAPPPPSAQTLPRLSASCAETHPQGG